MPVFHNTHYNLIDLLISYHPDVWRKACEKVAENHNNPSAIVREYSIVGVFEVTDLVMKDVEADNWKVDMHSAQVSVFVECALWSYYCDYKTSIHENGYRFAYPSSTVTDEAATFTAKAMNQMMFRVYFDNNEG